MLKNSKVSDIQAGLHISLSKKIFNNFITFLSGELAAKGIGFLVILFLARRLGAENFGKLGYAEAFLSYFIYLGIVGTDTIAVREVSRNKGLLPIYLVNMIAVKSILSVISFCGICIAAFFVSKTKELYVLILLYGLTLLPFALSTEWFFQGIEKMKYVGLFRVLRECLFGILIVTVIKSASGIYSVPLMRFTSMLIAALLFLYIIKRLHLSFNAKIDFNLWRYLIKESFPIISSQLLILLIYNFPVIYLATVRTNEEAGYYNAVYKMILFFIGFASVFWYVIFPTLSKLTIESKERLLQFQERVSKIIVSVAVPIGFIGSALASPIIRFLYGDSYQGSIELFRLLTWIGTLVMLNGIYAQGLLSSGNQNGFMKTVMVQTATSLLLNILLIPKFGLIGAAIAWLSAEGVGLFFYKFYYDTVIRLSIVRFIIRPLIAGIIACTVLIGANFFDFNVLLKISFGLVLYGMSLFAIGGIASNDIKFLTNNLVFLKRQKVS